MGERLTPVAIGLSSLAIAAGALFMLPIPEIAPVESNSVETIETEPSTEGESELPNPDLDATPNTTPNPNPDATPEPETSE